MKNSTVNTRLIVSASILMLCNPIAGASWRDSFSRENMTNIIWSKYGAIGGTLVALAIAGGVWAKWGKNIWNAISTPSSQNVLPPFERPKTLKTIDQLDRIYATQWPNLKKFHTFIESLIGIPQNILSTEEHNKMAWIELVAIPLGTSNIDELLKISNEYNFAWQFCYVLFKEYEIINALIKSPSQSAKLAPALALIKSLIPSFTADLVKKIEQEASHTGTIERCVTLLDILYAVERWPENFYTIIKKRLPNFEIQTKDTLIKQLEGKNLEVNTVLLIEKSIIQDQDTTLFINEHNRAVILSILDRLIALTKPEVIL